MLTLPIALLLNNTPDSFLSEQQLRHTGVNNSSVGLTSKMDTNSVLRTDTPRRLTMIRLSSVAPMF